jgi:hypothetical protein
MSRFVEVTFTHIHIHIYTTYTNIYTYTHTHTLTYTHIHIYTYTHIHYTKGNYPGVPYTVEVEGGEVDGSRWRWLYIMVVFFVCFSVGSYGFHHYALGVGNEL